ncbi:MAG: AAA family ATPase [Tannerella sp.]|nr:AAA family ATPase [Tannerella sp.]
MTFTPDDSNKLFNRAAEFVLHTDKNIFLTGKAGTGKTTFLRYIRQMTKKRTVVLAPTGVAAINAGGQTVHSFFQIGRGIYLPDDVRLRRSAPKDEEDKRTIGDYFRFNKDKTELMKSLELLVIDEVSMLRCDLMDVIDRLLRWVRDWESEPFGGVQVLLIGDNFQLPPIVSGEEWRFVEQYYDSPFFFSSRVIKENPLLYIELKTIYRQTDPRFIALLNNIRVNSVTPSDMALLQSRYMPDFQPDDKDTYIILASHNRIADDVNRTKLARLPAEEHVFEAVVTGVFPEEIMPAPFTLRLKEGAQVMFVKNNLPHYYNGQMGKITELTESDMIVTLPDGTELPVDITEWVNIRYSWNRKEKRIDEEIIGTFEQYPVRLAWAITVHKSQGLTFGSVIADVGGAFTHGQVYVALSRCSDFSRLVLRSQIGKESIRANPQALMYARNETSEAELERLLDEAKAEALCRQPELKMLASLPDMPVDEVFDKLDEYFNNTELNADSLYARIDALLSENTSALAQKLKAQKWDDETRAVFLYFCHLLVNSSYEAVELSDIQEIFSEKRDFRRVRLTFLNKSFPAIKSGYIRMLNKNSWSLTPKAKKAFLGELPGFDTAVSASDTVVYEQDDFKLKDDKTAKSPYKVVNYESITPKSLYYNAEERKQVESLTKLLTDERFTEVQQRLEAAGMRRGFACLFYGAPGTGKTETVYQIARQVERNILIVNISETKSAWYGESEKLIKDVFDRYRKYSAETGSCPILLFNEADAVIGKRLENTSHSIDQTANAIQNIILQEMETLDGILIATTNLTGNLDKAFERRFLYKVEFRKPALETRREIWQTLIPSLQAGEAQEFASNYDFSGGEIENISRKYTVESILSGDMLTIADLHRFCREEKITSQRAKVGF